MKSDADKINAIPDLCDFSPDLCDFSLQKLI